MQNTIKTSIEKGELTSGANISYWTDSVSQQIFPKLTANLETEVVVIGGGIAGLSVAYQIARQGMDVVVIEDGFIGSGETGRTSAHLTAVLDNRYFELEKMYNKETARLIAQSHINAISLIEQIAIDENIDCDFQRLSGFLFLHPSDDPESLSKEQTAARDAGLEVIHHNKVPVLKNTPGPCLEFPNQAVFHPLKYLAGLSHAVTKRGGHIYTGTHVDAVDERGITSKEGFRVTARHIVVATNSPVNNKYMMHLRQYPYRSYIIGAQIHKNTVANALFWDTGDQGNGTSFASYHYVRVHPHNDEYDLLIVGGGDHPTGLADADPPKEEGRYRELEDWMRARFPVRELIYQWSGQVLYAFDSLGYIGRNPMDKDNIYIVTGDNGNGLTYGTIAGQLITDLINGKENDYEKIYRPSRFNFLKAGSLFIEELVSGLTAYFKTKPKDPGDSIENIAAGEGKIIELDGKKYGIFRGYDHYLHIVNSECTHLGCIIKWNDDEKSWDCPCHGSRFTNTGTVVNGPANKNLNYHMIHESQFENIKSNLK